LKKLKMIQSKKKIDIVNLTFFMPNKDYKINILEATKKYYSATVKSIC
jgi:hypothetical protein